MDSPSSPQSDRRGATSRAALLRAARRLFAERGFHGTSVGEIADEAGLRKPSLFHHFPSKDALYRAVMDALYAELGDAVLAVVTSDATYADRLDTFNDTLTSFFASHPGAATLLFREAMQNGSVDGGLGDYGIERSVSIMRAAEKFLVEGIRAGEFLEQDARQLLLSLAGLHVTYHAIEPVVTPFLGASATSEEMLAARRVAVRNQVRALVLRPKTARR